MGAGGSGVISVDTDVAVVGAGPAGLACATDLATAGIAVRLVDPGMFGGQLLNVSEVVGAEAGTTGPGVAATMLEAAMTAGVVLEVDEATALERAGSAWRVRLASGALTAEVVVIATGSTPRLASIDGADRLVGAGVSFCAMCDGPLYAGRPVAACGRDPWVRDEARQLADLTGPVTVVWPADRPEPPAIDGVDVLIGDATGVEGEGALDAVVIETEAGRVRLPVAGLFVYDGRIPRAQAFDELLEVGPDGGLSTDDSLRCSSDGIYAIGEVRSGGPRRLTDVLADAERVAGLIVAAAGSTVEGAKG
jgi:thioredoxin reductase (NADPH)